MSYLPRPDADRTGEDVDEIYALTAEELSRAETAAARRKTFRNALLRAYEAGADAQRELIQNYPHDRPTPVPPPPETDSDITQDVRDPDPGTLPRAPAGVFNPHKRR